MKLGLARIKRRISHAVRLEWSLKKLGPHSSVHVQTLRLLRHFRINTVIDVGANCGQFAEGLFDFGFNGRLISFEPVEQVHAVLSKRARRYRNWIVYRPCALGSCPEVSQINISSSSVFSSLLTITHAHASAKPQSRVVGTQRVAVLTLDSLLEELSIEPERTLLKIDTQGYERDVLMGASKLIRSGLRGIKTEMPLFPIYEDTSWLFDDIYEYLRNNGYRMYSLSSEGVEHASGRTNTLDGTFFRGSCVDG